MIKPPLNRPGPLSDVTTVSSPRIERLRAIAARIVELESTEGFDTHTSPEFAALNDEIGAIAEVVWEIDPRGPTDLLERALVAHEFLADGVGVGGKHILCDFGPGGPMDGRAMRHLIDAVLKFTGAPEGGAND